MRHWQTVMAAIPLMAVSACTNDVPPQVPPGQQTSWDERGKTLDQALAGLKPGKPISCLPALGNVPSSFYGSTALYRAGGNRIYRNDLGPGCEALGRGDILVTQNTVGRSCRGDIVRTVDRVTGMQTGGCAFSDFVPYTRSK